MPEVLQLAIECGLDQNACRKIKTHFDGYTSEGLGGLKVRCTVGDMGPDELGIWWVGIVATTDEHIFQGSDDSKLLVNVAKIFYERLKSVKGFRFAVVGIECYQFNNAEALQRLLNHPALKGLVISDELFRSFNEPEGFNYFAPGYRQRPLLEGPIL